MASALVHRASRLHAARRFASCVPVPNDDLGYYRKQAGPAARGRLPVCQHMKITHDDCPVREVLSRVGDKWSILVVAVLRDGSLRFNELRRSIEGVSQRMLTLTLRGLERDGLVTRTVTPTTPPRVDYGLTRLGRTLLEPIMALADWAEKNRTTIQTSRQRFDETNRPGAPAPVPPTSRKSIRGPRGA